MTVKWANNARTTIADVSIAAGDTTINVATGDGALFPSLAAGEVFYATLVDTSGNREIVKVTARATDAMTVERGQEGTVARSFSQDDKFEIRLTAEQLELFCQRPSSATTNNITTFDASDDVQDSGYGIVDEDDMSSDSDTDLPTQQSVKAYVDALNSVPSGEIILFEKDTAVTGYTLLVDLDDIIVYIGSGSGAGGLSGAAERSGGTWTQPDHALTISEIPAHHHTYYKLVSGGADTDRTTVYNNKGNSLTNTSDTGGGAAHNHGDTYRPPGRVFTRQQRD